MEVNGVERALKGSSVWVVKRSPSVEGVSVQGLSVQGLSVQMDDHKAEDYNHVQSRPIIPNCS